MLIFVISIIIGFVALFFGANWLVKGSSFVARIYGVRPMIIGLTVVAFGTSAPEFVVSVNAGILGQSSITVGNIIGSIIANSTLILGISALIKPLKIETKLFKKEMPLLILSQVLFIVFIWNGSVSRLEGAVLFLGFMLFVWYCIKQAMNVSSKEKQRLELEYNEHLSRGGKSVSINALLIIVGLIALVVGSHFVVYGAIGLANIFAIPAFMIAASVVAFGT
ncbi:calcium:sodium antiporter, partial [bacterium]|nr:calcium:sodium antiporter [bacterium]